MLWPIADIPSCTAHVRFWGYGHDDCTALWVIPRQPDQRHFSNADRRTLNDLFFELTSDLSQSGLSRYDALS